MKTGNVILAIFLWLCIPASFFFGGFFGYFGGGTEGAAICAIITPILLFILGIIALVTGMEKQPIHTTYQSIQNQASSQGRNCPNCGQIIPFDAHFCSYCGKNFDYQNLPQYLKERRTDREEAEVMAEYVVSASKIYINEQNASNYRYSRWLRIISEFTDSENTVRNFIGAAMIWKEKLLALKTRSESARIRIVTAEEIINLIHSLQAHTTPFVIVYQSYRMEHLHHNGQYILHPHFQIPFPLYFYNQYKSI